MKRSQPLEEKEWGARVARVKPAPGIDQKTGEIAKLLGAERSSTRVELEFSLVGLCHRIQPTFREGMSQIHLTARTPIDQGRSRAIGWQARNYLREPEYDAERMAGILQAVAPTVAHLHGGGHDEQIAAALQQALWLALLLSVPGVLILLHPDPLLALLRIDPEVEGKARAYLGLLAIGRGRYCLRGC